MEVRNLEERKSGARAVRGNMERRYVDERNGGDSYGKDGGK